MMQKYTLILTLVFLILISLSSKEIRPDDYVLTTIDADLQQKWHKLTLTDSGYVIFNPCDRENETFRISNDTIFISYGHEVEYFFINYVKRNVKNVYQFAVRSYYSGKTIFFYFSYVDTDRGIAFWKNNDKPVNYETDDLYISDKNKNNFDIVNQPCKECWGDDCDEIE